MTNAAQTVLRPGTRADFDDIIGALILAFQRDEVSARYLFPDPGRRMVQHSHFFPPFLDAVFAAGPAGRVDVAESDAGIVAAALWLDVDDNAEPDHSIADSMAEHLDPESAGRFVLLDAMMADRHARMSARHRYLMFIGVDPVAQGHGIGTRLVNRGLADADVPAYLEASSPRNAALYRRLGFDNFGDAIKLAGGAALQPMWRRNLPVDPAA